MNFIDVINALTAQIVSFAQSDPVIALVAVIIIAFLIYRKPLFFLAIFCLILILAGVLYVIMDASGSGVSRKERMIHREAVPENIFRPSGLSS
jgi:ABC-type proline/glycine betaine transport system permease subunit